jgi:hypothetical protein
MQRQFNSELGGIKKKYDDAVSLVTDASHNLGGLFKNKMIKIKSKVSRFFADIDLRTNETRDSVFEIGKIVTSLQE